ncbi:MAG: hypothetical protein ACI8P0_002596 [Planctomycetaceae bacterium]|jgi:hypothetical protein
MSEDDRRKLRIRLRPEQASDPEWLMQTLPELLLQQFRQPESSDTDFLNDEPLFDPSVDALSNRIADQLSKDAPRILSKARQDRDKVSEAAKDAKAANDSMTINASNGSATVVEKHIDAFYWGLGTRLAGSRR